MEVGGDGQRGSKILTSFYILVGIGLLYVWALDINWTRLVFVLDFVFDNLDPFGL